MGDGIGDGRLEIDDVGSVIEQAYALDVHHGDDLLEGNDGSTWGERLESAGITPWLRRHRIALAVGTCAALAVGGLYAVREHSLPPPLDTSPAAVVTDAAIADYSGRGVFQSDPSTLTSAYLLSHERDGTTSTIDGITGPGIRASSAHAPGDGRPQQQADVQEVVAIVGCDDPDVLLPQANAYRLLMSQTDAYARVVHLRLPVPPTTAEQWAQSVATICARTVLPDTIAISQQGVHVDLADRSATVGLVLHNTSGHPVTVDLGGGDGAAQHVVAGFLQLARGASGRMDYTQRVIDCSVGRFDPASLPDPSGGYVQRVEGGNLFASLDDAVDSSAAATLTARWTRQVAAELRSAYSRICAGVPVASARVVSASLSPVDPSVTFATGGDPTLVALRMTVDVATAAERALISDPTAREELLDGATPRVTDGAARVSGGHALVTVDWLVGCNDVQAPPTVALTVGSGDRSWPLRARLSQRPLASAYAAACPLLSREDLLNNGWELAPPSP